jgi:thioredoxin-related protein
MKKSGLILLLLASQALSAWELEEKGLQFREVGLEQALRSAAKEKKLVFVSYYSSYCGSSRLMIDKVHPNKNVGKFFNDNFVNINVYVNTAEGVKLAQKYHAHHTPTFLFLRPDGSVHSEMYGYQESIDLLLAGRKAADSYRAFCAQTARQ